MWTVMSITIYNKFYVWVTTQLLYGESFFFTLIWSQFTHFQIETPNKTLPDLGIEPWTSCSLVALTTGQPGRQKGPERTVRLYWQKTCFFIYPVRSLTAISLKTFLQPRSKLKNTNYSYNKTIMYVFLVRLLSLVRSRNVILWYWNYGYSCEMNVAILLWQHSLTVS